MSGVYVDDGGTPGASAPSGWFHGDRRTWAAVIVPPAVERQVRSALDIFLDGVARDFNASELHFTEIYSGVRAFRGVDYESRIELFDLMARLFETFRLPILVQSSSSEYYRESRDQFLGGLGNGSRASFFNFGKHDHFGLFVLLTQVLDFIRANAPAFPTPVELVVDEGLARAGTTKCVTRWADVFLGGEVRFGSSRDLPLLQLADFAAFATCRTQWLLAKGFSRKQRDVQFLTTVSANRLNYVNLPMTAVDLSRFTTADYEGFLREDRRRKGLAAELQDRREQER